MAEELREALAAYLMHLGCGNTTEELIRRNVVHCSTMLRTDASDEELVKELKRITPDGFDVQVPVSEPGGIAACHNVIMHSGLSDRTKEVLCYQLTESHTIRMVNWAIRFISEGNLMIEQVVPWFRYPQWRVPFLNHVLNNDEFRLFSLDNLNPGVCELFVKELLRHSNDKDAVDFYGSLNPMHTWLLHKYPTLTQRIRDSIRSDELALSGHVDAGTYRHLMDELNNKLELENVPISVKQFSNNYFVPYSKILEYKKDGARIYSQMTLLNIWGTVTDAECGSAVMELFPKEG